MKSRHAASSGNCASKSLKLYALILTFRRLESRFGGLTTRWNQRPLSPSVRYRGLRPKLGVVQLVALGVAVTRFGLWLRQRAALAFRAAAVFAALLALPPFAAAFRSQSGYWFFMLPLKRGVRKFQARRLELAVSATGREVSFDCADSRRLLLGFAAEVAFLPSSASGRSGLEFVAPRAVVVRAVFAKSHRAGFVVTCDVRFHVSNICQAALHCNIYFQLFSPSQKPRLY